VVAPVGGHLEEVEVLALVLEVRQQVRGVEEVGSGGKRVAGGGGGQLGVGAGWRRCHWVAGA